ncbi:MAG: DUF1700 domain-containing protein [Oscillospiraceae bacterium]|nr:DUF1700 domain-containing protein [Oscillospiraceae bacterium]
MNKQQFLEELRMGLSGLPKDDIDERLSFYSEMIDDRIEEGISEEEAVLAVGSVSEIVEQIVSDIPLVKIAKERIKSKRHLKAWEIILLALGSPIWFSLAVVVFAVIFSLYIVLWSLIISLWSVFASVVACGVGGIAVGIGFAFFGNTLTGIAIIGAGIFCTGISILLFFLSKVTTKGILLLTKKIILSIKNKILKGEEVK